MQLNKKRQIFQSAKKILPWSCAFIANKTEQNERTKSTNWSYYVLHMSVSKTKQGKKTANWDKIDKCETTAKTVWTDKKRISKWMKFFCVTFLC